MLVFFRDRDPDSLSLALRVAEWTIDKIQNQSGYIYYRRYSRWLVNGTPTLHWGQATMLCALAGLYKALYQSNRDCGNEGILRVGDHFVSAGLNSEADRRLKAFQRTAGS